MAKGNPNPVQTDKFKQGWYKPKGEVYSDKPLADKPTQVRLAEDITEAINALGEEKTPWLRRVITEAVRRELMQESLSTVKHDKDRLVAIAIKHCKRSELPKAWQAFIDELCHEG